MVLSTLLVFTNTTLALYIIYIYIYIYIYYVPRPHRISGLDPKAWCSNPLESRQDLHTVGEQKKLNQSGYKYIYIYIYIYICIIYYVYVYNYIPCPFISSKLLEKTPFILLMWIIKMTKKSLGFHPLCTKASYLYVQKLSLFSICVVNRNFYPTYLLLETLHQSWVWK